jgi:DNA-binding transcriptional LysR family regulator
MDRLNSMRMFTQVAESGSFSRAAQVLNVSAAAVTRGIAELEAHLGARLLNRTTRHVSLTEVGEQYLERCRTALQAFEEADDIARSRALRPQGTLRLHCPVAFGRRFMTPILARYNATYPQVRFDLTLSDRLAAIDLVEEGYDLAVMILPDGMDANVVARLMFYTQLVLVAAPDYLARHPLIKNPAQLEKHTVLTFSFAGIRDQWRLLDAQGNVAAISLEPLLTTNSSDCLLQAALSGMGVAVVGNQLVGEDLAAGRLKLVLPDWNAGRVGVYAAYPTRRYLPAKVKTFVDLMLQWFEMSRPGFPGAEGLIFTP